MTNLIVNTAAPVEHQCANSHCSQIGTVIAEINGEYYPLCLQCSQNLPEEELQAIAQQHPERKIKP